MTRFLDTNVLLYSISTHIDEADKRRRAVGAIERGDVVVSVQVLQEFYVQATRASRPDRLEHLVAVGLIGAWRRFPVVPNTVELMDAALDLALRNRLSYWDAAIVSEAASAGCEQLLSEDLARDSSIAGVRLVNPFL